MILDQLINPGLWWRKSRFTVCGSKRCSQGLVPFFFLCKIKWYTLTPQKSNDGFFTYLSERVLPANDSSFRGVNFEFCCFSPSRTYKYDDNQLEFFVETSDTVKIRKSDLDKLTRAEELDVKEHLWATKLIHSKGLR